MAWGIVDLFRAGFNLVAERLASSGRTTAELREAFHDRFPGQPIPHANTFNALFQRARLSADIANRINRGVRPRAASYPQVPKGIDCEGFQYRVIVEVSRPVFGQPRQRERVDVPIEVQSDKPAALDDLKEIAKRGFDELLGSKSRYELLAAGVAYGNFKITGYRVASAYRC
jgi:hypothetical protein